MKFVMAAALALLASFPALGGPATRPPPGGETASEYYDGHQAQDRVGADLIEIVLGARPAPRPRPTPARVK